MFAKRVKGGYFPAIFGLCSELAVFSFLNLYLNANSGKMLMLQFLHYLRKFYAFAFTNQIIIWKCFWQVQEHSIANK